MNPNLSESAKYDVELIYEARHGIEKAYGQLLNRYKKTIYLMLLKMVNNRTDAEDLTIEAFEKAFINIHQYEPQFAFSTWLFCIASNNAIDQLRKKRLITVPLDSSTRNDKTTSPEQHYNQCETNDNPEEALIKAQYSGFVRKAVLSLKPRYRTLLELRYFKEYSYSEICKELNLPLGTVKVRLFRSREMLYNRLKDSNKTSAKNEMQQPIILNFGKNQNWDIHA